MNALKWAPMVATLVYAVLGMIALVGGYWVVDKICPTDIWNEVVKGNLPLSILSAAFVIALGLIIAAAIHG